MDDAAQNLKSRKYPSGKDVAQKRYSEHSPSQKRSMPALGDVCGIVENDEALKDGTLKKAYLGAYCHPGEDLQSI
jgi:hypothetical protein